MNTAELKKLAEASKSLYSITGNVVDLNTLLVNRDSILELLAINAELVEALKMLEAMAERYRPPGYPTPDAQKIARAALARYEGEKE